MLRAGRIIAVDASVGRAAVALHPPGSRASGGCTLCARGLGCQALHGGGNRPMRLVCELPHSDGDADMTMLIGRDVDVQVPESDGSAVRVVALGYGLPTLALVAGCLCGDQLGIALRFADTDTGAVVSAVPGMLGGVCGLLAGVLIATLALRVRVPASAARPCQPAARIVSVATTPPPSPTGTHDDDHPV